MKNLFRLFFIFAVFVSSVCFAGEREEKANLEKNILLPIMNHYGKLASSSKLHSLELIKYHKENKKQTNYDSYPFLPICSDPNYRDLSRKICIVQSMWKTCPILGVVTTKGFVEKTLYSWNQKVSNCGEYADLVMIAFEFYYMNNSIKVPNPQLFKRAAVIHTRENGDHRAVLVEGFSGAVFLLDPWSEQVEKVQSFPRLDKIPELANASLRKAVPNMTVYDREKIYPLGENTFMIDSVDLNTQLNILFRDKETGYYDGWYVEENTTWELDMAATEILRSFVRVKSGEMENLYNTLKPSFPEWISDYNSLFPASAAQPATTVAKPNSEVITLLKF
jgi:hypothetical protein